MNENEAIEYLQSRYLAVGSRVNPQKEECERHNEVVDMAIKALEEVQQYRAIGTPEECRAAVEADNETTRIIDGITECCGYDFGTDAFQVELSKYCPVCGRKIERSSHDGE